MFYLFLYFIGVFFVIFFPSPISRLDNPRDLQISLRVCLSFPGYSSSPNKLPQWIIQFQIAGRLQLKVSIWFFKNISLYPPEVPLFILCGSISLYVIDSGHSSCCEGLAWQLQHVTVFSLGAKLMSSLVLCMLCYLGLPWWDKQLYSFAV